MLGITYTSCNGVKLSGMALKSLMNATHVLPSIFIEVSATTYVWDGSARMSDTIIKMSDTAI